MKNGKKHHSHSFHSTTQTLCFALHQQIVTVRYGFAIVIIFFVPSATVDDFLTNLLFPHCKFSIIF